jgi:hypothetical protein
MVNHRWLILLVTDTEQAVPVLLSNVNMTAASVYFQSTDTLITLPLLSTTPTLTVGTTVQLSVTTMIQVNAPFNSSCMLAIVQWLEAPYVFQSTKAFASPTVQCTLPSMARHCI